MRKALPVFFFHLIILILIPSIAVKFAKSSSEDPDAFLDRITGGIIAVFVVHGIMHVDTGQCMSTPVMHVASACRYQACTWRVHVDTRHVRAPRQ